MKKIKSFLKGLTEFNQKKAESNIMIHFTEFESNALTTEQQLSLFNAIKTKFDVMILSKRIEAERDAQLISYFQGEYKSAPTYLKELNNINVN